MALEGTRLKKILGEALVRAEDIDSPETLWIKRLYKFYPDDIGVLSPAFLNLLTIAPPEAVFLPPGVIHAYLRGVGIEIMANSDNVLRGGLTKKHVAPEELLKAVQFLPQPPYRMKPLPANRFEQYYPSETDEFVLSEIRISSGATWQGPAVHSADILLCMHGQAELTSEDENFSLVMGRGQSALVPAAAGAYTITGGGVFYKAGVRL